MSAEKLNINHSQETKVALLEQSIGGINSTLTRIENDLKEYRKEIQGNLLEDRKESRALFKWIMGSILGIYTLIFYTIKLIH